jgi:hypothetical protein
MKLNQRRTDHLWPGPYAAMMIMEPPENISPDQSTAARHHLHLSIVEGELRKSTAQHGKALHQRLRERQEARRNHQV